MGFRILILEDLSPLSNHIPYIRTMITKDNTLPVFHPPVFYYFSEIVIIQVSCFEVEKVLKHVWTYTYIDQIESTFLPKFLLVQKNEKQKKTRKKLLDRLGIYDGALFSQGYT